MIVLSDLFQLVTLVKFSAQKHLRCSNVTKKAAVDTMIHKCGNQPEEYDISAFVRLLDVNKNTSH